MNIRKWLIKKLAGNRLVILNATMIYKYYPIFADTSKDPIIDENLFVQNTMESPFHLYARTVFEDSKKELKMKPEYLEAYNKHVAEIQKQLDETKEKSETEEGTPQ